MQLLIVDESAMKQWVNYVERHPAQDVYRMVVDMHRGHVSRSLGGETFDCGLFLTDVPEADLTVLEIRSGEKTGLYLYSREEAVEMAHCIMNALGMSSQEVQ